MYLRLTDTDNNLLLINADKVVAFFLETVKGIPVTKIGLENGYYLTVKETVSEISLLLQEANKVIK